MQLSEFPAHADAAARKVHDSGPMLQRIAYAVLGPVKRRTRVRTGALRNSLHDRVVPNKAIVATNVQYAPFVNARYPFLLPGYEDAKPRVEDELHRFGLEISAEVRG